MNTPTTPTITDIARRLVAKRLECVLADITAPGSHIVFSLGDFGATPEQARAAVEEVVSSIRARLAPAPLTDAVSGAIAASVHERLFPAADDRP